MNSAHCYSVNGLCDQPSLVMIMRVSSSLVLNVQFIVVDDVGGVKFRQSTTEPAEFVAKSLQQNAIQALFEN